MPTQHQDTRRAIVLSLFMVFLASTATAATKYAAGRASIEAIVTVQYTLCTLLCLPITLRHGLDGLRTARGGLHFARGAAGVMGFYLFYAALENIPMVDALLLRQSAPLVVPLVMFLWQRERMAGATWWPIAIGFAGVAIMLRPSPSGLSWWHAAGFVSAVALAFSMVATHHLARTEPPSRILFYYCALAALCVAPFSLADFSGLGWQAWAAMLYVGVAIYFTLDLYTRAYGMAPASTLAPITYLGVVLGGFWGWLFWDQVPDAWTVAGSALVIGGGLLTMYLAAGEARRPVA